MQMTVVPYIRDLVHETKQLNLLTANARMRYAILKVWCNQQYGPSPRCRGLKYF